MAIRYKPKMDKSNPNNKVNKSLASATKKYKQASSGTININPSSPKSGPITLTLHPNPPPSTPPNPFIGWTARVFQGVTDEKPESEIPPTMKSGQIELNGFEGCICAKCKEFYPYAEPNMDDGTLVCYSCRNPWPN